MRNTRSSKSDTLLLVLLHEWYIHDLPQRTKKLEQLLDHLRVFTRTQDRKRQPRSLHTYRNSENNWWLTGFHSLPNTHSQTLLPELHSVHPPYWLCGKIAQDLGDYVFFELKNTQWPKSTTRNTTEQHRHKCLYINTSDLHTTPM
jgi:hypothetical protein